MNMVPCKHEIISFFIYLLKCISIPLGIWWTCKWTLGHATVTITSKPCHKFSVLARFSLIFLHQTFYSFSPRASPELFVPWFHFERISINALNHKNPTNSYPPFHKSNLLIFFTFLISRSYEIQGNKWWCSRFLSSFEKTEFVFHNQFWIPFGFMKWH